MHCVQAKGDLPRKMFGYIGAELTCYRSYFLVSALLLCMCFAAQAQKSMSLAPSHCELIVDPIAKHTCLAYANSEVPDPLKRYCMARDWKSYDPATCKLTNFIHDAL
jgi:hypothetical protein